MLKRDVDPVIVDSMCKCLTSWTMGINPLWQIQRDNPLYDVISQQAQIGWFNMIGGYVANQWVNLQACYFLSKKSKRS